MYSVAKQDEAVHLHELPAPDAGAPLPFLDADEHIARVTYSVRDGAAATVTFSGLHALLFGAPNDEASEGHPLASRGLAPYGAFEVRRSSWIRSLERMNQVHSAHQAEAFNRLRHFIIVFHDSTFECAAVSASV
jgi:hypothetical protein